MDSAQLAAQAVAVIRIRPGASTRVIAETIGASEDETYLALYRAGRHFGVGLTVFDGWQTAHTSGEVADRLTDPFLAPCPTPSPDEVGPSAS